MTTVSPTVLGGRYVLGDLLGSGGMARVYRAHDSVLAREVAVKVFRQDEVLPDADARRGGEVRLLAGLSHPGLVMVFDAGRDDSDPIAPFSYLVMELVDGTTLARVLDAGPLDASRVATIGAQLAGALGYVHARGVVHRDIKPANVLMGGPGSDVAKLTDFGVARMLDSTRMTLHGTTVGTANYLSPEQATGDEVGPASDVYSLGLVLLECLTATVAFAGHGVAAAVIRLNRAPDIPSWIDPAWRALLSAMTAREPVQRPSAAVVAARLAALAGPSADDTGVIAASPAATVRAGRRGRLVVAAAALVAAASVAGTAIATSGGTGAPAAAAADTSGYPSVAGQLGHDLHTLEALAPAPLRPTVTTVAQRSAVHDYHGAQSALSRVLAQVAGLHAQRQVDDPLSARLATAIALVSSDLMRGQLMLDAAKSAADRRAARAQAQAAARATKAAALRAARQAARARAQAVARAAAAARAAATARQGGLQHPGGPHHWPGHGHHSNSGDD